MLALLRRGWTRRRARTAIIVAGAGAIALLIALHGVNKLLLGDLRPFSLDADLSVSSAWTVLLFVLAAVSWWWLSTTAGPATRAWPAMSVLCAALALEGVLQLHARLETWLGSDVNLFVIQPVLALAVLALFFACCRRLPAPERYLMAAAAVTLALAQLASMANGSSDYPYALVVALQTLEESLEMFTGTLLIAVPIAVALSLTESQGREISDPAS